MSAAAVSRPASDTLRAFFALALGAEQREALTAFVAGLRGEPWADRVRWVAPASLHLTLRFLGDVPRDSLKLLAERMREVARGCEPFEIALPSAGFFPSPRRPHVVAVVVEEIAPLVELARRIERGVVAHGLPGDGRKLRAHITLGRIRGRPGATPTKLPPLVVEPLAVREFELYRSTLTPSGPVYEVIDRFDLSG